MANTMAVQWQNSYSVGIRLVDEQHKELIRLTNRLFANCMAGQERSKNSFLDIIHEVVDYTGYHFGTEEKIMERVRYPSLLLHKREHTNFVREVYEKVDELKSGKKTVPIAFAYFLRDWVLEHIAVSDRKMGEYLLAMKRCGELQKVTLKVKKDLATERMLIR